MQTSPWHRCVQQLRSDLPEQQFNTWIRPLQAVEDNSQIRLLAPNRFVVEWISTNCLGRINELLQETPGISVTLEVGSVGTGGVRRPAAVPATTAGPTEASSAASSTGIHLRQLRRGRATSSPGGGEPGRQQSGRAYNLVYLRGVGWANPLMHSIAT